MTISITTTDRITVAWRLKDRLLRDLFDFREARGLSISDDSINVLADKILRHFEITKDELDALLRSGA